ncbi:anti-sigma factor domain-containing protein [Carboxydocella sp. JDF658]|uniref:anti-sigma factor domain-containing protein n=1 Tax=Carboxydocella sp. JDF658 TaxID=1926600 RepID=UPI0009ADCB17|nr:anti-sigma factor domain-containing protein [Carboxydocella sp. JDF658]GAW31062.1 Anti-sigma factor N-terminus [Carboxydocella sp. JDF658]
MKAKIKGMVVKRDGKYLIVLTPDGDFHRIPAKNHQVNPGEEIIFTPASSLSWPNWALSTLAAAFALLFLLAALKLMPQQNHVQETVNQPPAVKLKEKVQIAQAEPVAFLTVDINPSIELGLTEDGRILSARGLNPDGQRLLAKAKLQGLTWEEALDQILDLAAKNNYLPRDKQNLIVTTLTVVKKNKVKPTVAKERVKLVLAEKIKAKAIPAQAIALEAEPADKEEADKQQVSVGKYLTWKRLKARGKKLDIEDMKKHSIRDIQADENESIFAEDDDDEKKEDLQQPQVQTQTGSKQQQKPEFIKQLNKKTKSDKHKPQQSPDSLQDQVPSEPEQPEPEPKPEKEQVEKESES